MQNVFIKLDKESSNKIKSTEKNIDDEIFRNYFGNPNSSHFIKYLFGVEEDTNKKKTVANDANNSIR